MENIVQIVYYKSIRVGAFMKKKGQFDVQAALQLELTSQPLHITGYIPEWLSGTLIRNGPIQVEIDGRQNSHWFDGLAMLHAFTFDRGTIKYTNKFIRSEAYHKVFKEGALDYLGFATDPCRSIFKRFLTLFSKHVIRNANVNIVKLAEEYVAFTEIPLPVRFDLTTLETLGVFDYEDNLPKGGCWESAHPHYDKEKNETINYLIQYGPVNYYLIYKMVGSSSRRQLIAKIPVDEPAYMHSFAVTENYIILTEFPFVVHSLDLLIKGKPFISNFVWKEKKGTQFIVIDRDKGHVLGRYFTYPFFAFHHVNAYEKETDLLIDVVAYPDAAIVSGIKDRAHLDERQDKVLSDFGVKLIRFTLPLMEGEIRTEVLLKEAFELPRFNDVDYEGKLYRYAYGVDLRELQTSQDKRSLYKVDVETKETLTWSSGGVLSRRAYFCFISQSNKRR